MKKQKLFVINKETRGVIQRTTALTRYPYLIVKEVLENIQLNYYADIADAIEKGQDSIMLHIPFLGNVMLSGLTGEPDIFISLSKSMINDIALLRQDGIGALTETFDLKVSKIFKDSAEDSSEETDEDNE